MIGEVKMFTGNYAPRGWARLDGQLLSIAQNQTLFAIMGTQFGGNGSTTFALPDMRGRSAIGVGQGPGLRPFFIGDSVGAESAQLLPSNMPVQVGNAQLTQLVDTCETVQAGKARGNGAVVEIPVLEETQVLVPFQMNGGSMPVNIRQPSLGLTHIICLVGYFPSRS